MSQKKGDGDVLANKVSLMQAKGQRLLASLLGPKPEPDSENITLQAESDDDDLKKAFVDPEQLGIGGIAPKDVEDGSFTKRIPTSDDKLLAQLIGNKRAKAHIASKQNAKQHNKQPNNSKPSGTSKKREDSEDEEEGRSAAFKSKRRKTNRSQPVPVENSEETMKEQEGARDGDHSLRNSSIKGPLMNPDTSRMRESKLQEEQTDKSRTTKTTFHRSKSKPTSFLDEILAERSKKKKKQGSKTGTDI